MPDTTAPLDTLSGVRSLNNRVNLRFLDGLSERQLKAAIGSRGRTVVSLFAHIHFIRIAWLERRVPSAARGLKKIDRETVARANIAQALEASAKAMGELFTEAEKTGQMKGTKMGPLTFLAYCLAHEAHHRGQFIVHLKYAKLPVDKAVGYSLWEWHKI